MSEKFLIVYNQQHGENEAVEFEGTLEEAIEDATLDSRHWNSGRRGVKIYKVSEPVFEKLERD